MQKYRVEAAGRLESISMPTDNYFYKQASLALEQERGGEDVSKEEIVRRALKIADSTEQALSAEKKKIEAILAGTDIKALRDSIRKDIVGKLEEKKRRIEEAIQYFTEGEFERANSDQYFQSFLQELSSAEPVPFHESAEEKAIYLRQSLEQAYQRWLEEVDARVESQIEAIKRNGERDLAVLEEALNKIPKLKEELSQKLEEIENAKTSPFVVFIKKMWTWLTTLVLLVLYFLLAWVGVVWLGIGVDRLALSLNTEKGVGELFGDVLPVPPLKIALHYTLAQLTIWVGIGVLLLLWGLVWSILSLVLVGDFSIVASLLDEPYKLMKFVEGGIPLAPALLLLSLVLVVGIYLLTWPTTFYILRGENFISAISNSFRFFRSSYNKLVLFEFSRAFIFVFINMIMLFIAYDLLDDVLDYDLEKLISKFGVLDTLLLIGLLVVWGISLIFLTLMRAAFFVGMTEGEEREQAEVSTPSAEA